MPVSPSSAARLVLVCLALASAPAHASDAVRPGRYEITIETGTPEHEENLSHALRRELRCLDRSDLASLFWLLGDAALRDCRLEKSGEEPGAATYDLICAGAHGSAGTARWQIGAASLRGELNVRRPGTDTILYQRVTAKRLGGCADGTE